jgi:hypothetical protein
VLVHRRTLLGGALAALAASHLLAPVMAGLAVRDGRDVIVALGDTPVYLVETVGEPPRPTYLSLHENEQTAVVAARRIVERLGGRLVELRAQRKRLVSFMLGPVRYAFDPNRIFTDGGIAKTLRRYGKYTSEAHAAVGKLAAAILDLAVEGPDALLVAVHNNSAGALSVESYRPGGPLQSEAAQVVTSRAHAPDDFFLVTEPSLFERLRALSFNVVLQSPLPTDDGSLSVYCQGRLPYVNVEARFGHLAEQVRMLEAVHSLLAAG